MYDQLGYSALVGLGVRLPNHLDVLGCQLTPLTSSPPHPKVIIVGIPLQMIIVTAMFAQRKKGVKITDQRIRITTEVSAFYPGNFL
jgi:hypothetical protein